MLRAFCWFMVVFTIVIAVGLLWYGVTTGIFDTDHRDGYPHSLRQDDGAIA